MLAYGIISPHPPIIIPEIAGGDIKKVAQTVDALDTASRSLAEARPEAIIIISPHEEHGFDVPLFYVHKYLSKTVPIEKILVTQASYEYYYQYGKSFAGNLSQDKKRYAVIASGDLSHVLKTDGPYGYHPSGPKLDELIVQAVQTRDAKALLALDPALMDEGAECGLRSILFLLGVFEEAGGETEVLSYEGPFGVGYLVATLNPISGDQNLRSNVPLLARNAVRHYLNSGQIQTATLPIPKNLPEKAGVFVSLHEKDGTLRGCIGTTQPTRASLQEEIAANAVLAATQDPRFQEVSSAELDNLTISVDVLSPIVPETDLAKLDPKRYGIVVSTKDGRSGVLLPDLEGVDTVQEQIKICREKAGIDQTETVTIAKFQVERFAD